MGSMAGRVAVITGAGSGIGRALAVELDRQGCRLALSDIDLDAVTETARVCSDARAYEVDVARRPDLEAHVDAVIADFGGVDIVVNNAGVTVVADAERTSQQDVDWVMDVNLNAVIASSQLFLPHLIASGDGHLVNISSVFGIIAMPSQSIYNASKFGVRGYSEAVAMEMAINGHPVQVHTVHPGGIRTNIVRDARIGPAHDSAALVDVFTRVLARTSAESAARTIVRGMRRGRRRIHIGLDAHAVHVAERLLGASYMTGLTRVVPAFMRLTGVATSVVGSRAAASNGPGGVAPATDAPDVVDGAAAAAEEAVT